jgi:hypothetical protein
MDYLCFGGLACLRVVLRGISINKLYKKKTKGVKFYLRLIKLE